MADNILLNAPSVVGGKTVATKDFGGAQHELIIQEFVDSGGNPVEVSATNPLPVLAAIDTTGLATSLNQDTEITALNALVVGQQSDALTDTELRATPVPISGTVNTGLTQPLTDAQLRATPVPVSGTVTVDTSLLATAAKQDTGNTSLASIDTKLTNPLPVSQSSQPLPTGASTSALQTTGNTSLASIDTKLTNPLPVSASTLPLPTLAATSTKQSDGSQKSQIVDGSGNVIGATSNALNVNISSGSGTLPTGAATSALQTTGNTSLSSIDAKTPALGQALAAASSPVVLTAAEEAILSAILTITDFDTKTGSLTETAPATDTASSGLNGRLQRIAQRISSMIALLPTSLGAGGGLKIDGSGTALPITGTVAVTGAGDASASNQTLQITQETAINTVLGLISDAIVAAGATGSISAKLRRATQGLEDLKTLISLGASSNVIGHVINDASSAVIGHVIVDSGTITAVTSITNNVNTVEVSATALNSGITTVTTAGTRVQTASNACKSVTVKAKLANTGKIYVGNVTVSAANGFELGAGDTISLDISNTNLIYIDSSVNGEGISFIFIT